MATIPDFDNEKQIIEYYQSLQQEYQSIQQKIVEIESDLREHELVVTALADMDDSRRCYRLVGGVMVERTVGQVVPAVEKNKAGIEDLIEKMGQQLDIKGTMIKAVQEKYNIRFRDSRAAQQADVGAASSQSDTRSGVLA
ncbi:KE2 family protein [Thecamonas trahens ATCC 50062]|uniref:KE2 family protein n=1 Tax=Thecamonas trahens ATCC 50062 TaxID=461836 RepID=A0A0L0DL27_THETB|nr:KE2 family protein [Thecamonas trahens ATCC 50062]KNC52731.1 KE2 family protein [Thecamonas trahens ATCC 50062]|eukprot:XP_013755045.1 KE2 family protein [Thecamonas trahens ATCC 50062]